MNTRPNIVLVHGAWADGEPQLSEAAKSELSTALQAFLPDAPLTWMIGLGADAVAAELASVRPAANGS